MESFGFVPWGAFEPWIGQITCFGWFASTAAKCPTAVWAGGVTGRDTPRPEKQPQCVCFSGPCPPTPAQVNVPLSSASLGALYTGASRLPALLSASPGLLWSGGLAIPPRGSSSPWGPVFVEGSGPCQPIFLSTLSPRPPSLLLWSRSLSCPRCSPLAGHVISRPSQLCCVSAWLSSSPPSSRLPLEPCSGPWALLLGFLGLDLLSRSLPFIWPLQASSWGHVLPRSLLGDFLSHQEGAPSAGVQSPRACFPLLPCVLLCAEPPSPPQGWSVCSSSRGRRLSPGVHRAAAAPCSAIRALAPWPSHPLL